MKTKAKKISNRNKVHISKIAGYCLWELANRLLASLPPVTGPASAMGDGEYLNHHIGFTVNEKKGKAGEFHLTGIVCTSRPTLRRSADFSNHFFNLGYESPCGALAPLSIPACSSLGLLHRRRVKGDAPLHHLIAEESRARACSKEIGFTLPESRSAIRRPTSSSQATSTAGSSAVSRLSIRDPASSARSLTGRASAFFSRFEDSRVMAPSYRETPEIRQGGSVENGHPKALCCVPHVASRSCASHESEVPGPDHEPGFRRPGTAPGRCRDTTHAHRLSQTGSSSAASDRYSLQGSNREQPGGGDEPEK